MFAEDEARLLTSAAPTDDALERLVRRRTAGEPLEHLLGWVDFAGLRLVVTPGVFVPRRRSELLVAEGVAALADSARASGRGSDRGSEQRRPLVLVELCCGVAAVAAAMVHRVQRGPAPPELDVSAADLDPHAVDCARQNLPAGALTCVGDLYDPLPERLRGRIDVLIANAPYVPTDSVALMPPEARLHEPRLALDGGPDGLDVQRRVIADAPLWLAPGGRLLIEAGRRQAPVTAELMRGWGLTARIARDEDLDATAVIGTLRGSHPR